MKYFKILPILFLLGACGDPTKPKDCEIKGVNYYEFNSIFNQWQGPTYRLMCIVKEENIS